MKSGEVDVMERDHTAQEGLTWEGRLRKAPDPSMSLSVGPKTQKLSAKPRVVKRTSLLCYAV